ncbi:transposase [Elysia marginata]|uniref:Transposase n=1 Tax=Elysia marginata TaxID=1093978 RepID=A0AAV4FHJ0_9GAST|nr:transposase [Elysia marginata]
MGTKLLQVQGVQGCCLCKKVTFTVFWDMEGVVYIEFVEQGQSMNSKQYISTFRALKLRLRRACRVKDSILQHENARLHTTRQTRLKAAGTYDSTAPSIQPRSCPL